MCHCPCDRCWGSSPNKRGKHCYVMKGRGLASSPFNSLVFAETYATMYKIHTFIVERDRLFLILMSLFPIFDLLYDDIPKFCPFHAMNISYHVILNKGKALEFWISLTDAVCHLLVLSFIKHSILIWLWPCTACIQHKAFCSRFCRALKVNKNTQSH